MRIFLEPQDPFLEKDFVTMLKKYTRVTLINWIPTIHGKTFFWSTKKYDGIKKQYCLDENIRNAKMFFYVKYPCPYTETFKNYHKHFRNQVKKAQTNNLSCEIIEKANKTLIDECYVIYDSNMKKRQASSIALESFTSLATLPYAYFMLIRFENTLVSFWLILGNLLFIQSSTEKGKLLCASNFLYDRLLYTFENKPVFIGIASKNNTGLNRFKKQAGLTPIPAKATFFDINNHIPKFFRHKKFVGYILRVFFGKKTLKNVLPY